MRHCKPWRIQDSVYQALFRRTYAGEILAQSPPCTVRSHSQMLYPGLRSLSVCPAQPSDGSVHAILNLLQARWAGHTSIRSHAFLIQISFQISFRSRLDLIQIPCRFHSEIMILLRSHSVFIQISSRTHPDPFQISFTFSQYDSVP